MWTWLGVAAQHHITSLAVVESENEALLTYEALHSQAIAVASFFTAHGVHSGARIGVLGRNCAAVILAHFAAAATRAVIVNCNVQLAPAELTHVLRDAHVEVVLADVALKERLLHEGVLQGSTVERIIWVGGGNPHVGGMPAAVVLPVLSPHPITCVSPPHTSPDTITTHAWETEVLTYNPSPATTSHLASIRAAAQPSDHYQIYYTSGTTGKPKAVALTHAMVSLHAVGAAQEMQLDSTDVWCHVAPMYHLVDAFAIYAVTLVGGRHVTVANFAASELPLVLGMWLQAVCVVVLEWLKTVVHTKHTQSANLKTTRSSPPTPPQSVSV